jgi:hypothetical protein
MKKRDTLILILVIPLLLNSFVYYGFNSAYNNYRYYKEIPEHYYHTIYGYRILSREILAIITRFFNDLIYHYDIPFKNYILDKGTGFYHSIFLFNTICFIGVSWIFNKILQVSVFSIEKKFRYVTHLLLLCLVSLSQYVVTPYDNSALFLFLVTSYFTLQYYISKEFKYLITISVFIAISAFNRETASLNIAFLGALFFPQNFFNKKDFLKFFKVVFLPVVAFIFVYVLVRFFKPQEPNSINEGFYIVENLTRLNEILGWVFAITFLRFSYLISNSEENKKLITKFIFLTSPYLLMLIFVGILWEIRLYMPLIFGAVILGWINCIDSTEND